MLQFDLSIIESLKENNVSDPASITNSELKAIFQNIQPNDNPIIVLAEKNDMTYRFGIRKSSIRRLEQYYI